MKQGALRIAANLSLPLDVATQTTAILALRRVGKTYAASVLVEEMMKARLPVVVLDPTGAWWGLRASADGQKAGYPVVIIGGEHGDVPLEPVAGKILADLVVDHPGWYVIDFSQTTSNAEQDRIAGDFAEQLYRRKAKKPFPLHLVVDEADSFAPQQVGRNRRTLDAFEAIVRRGGVRGLGTTLITQRSAVLSKNVLTQADNLLVLRITSPQDRAAIEEWIKGNGTPEERKEMMAALASLAQGEAYFWSPGALNIFRRIKIRTRETFNSSATPKPGEHRVEPQNLATVNLEALRGKMASTIEKAKAEDPAILKERIRQLESEARRAPAPVDSAQFADIKAKHAALTLEVERWQQAVDVCAAQFASVREAVLALEPVAKRVVEELTRIKNDVVQIKSPLPSVPKVPARSVVLPVQPRVLPEQSRPVATSNGHNASLGEGERLVLVAIAQYTIDGEGADREQLTVLTGYKRSTRDAYIQRLSAKGLVTVNKSAGRVLATDAGIKMLGDNFEPLPTGDALQDYWMERLPEGERKILAYLLEAYPHSVERDALTKLTGYQRSTRDAYLQRLGARKLVLTGRGEATASSILFE